MEDDEVVAFVFQTTYELDALMPFKGAVMLWHLILTQKGVD